MRVFLFCILLLVNVSAQPLDDYIVLQSISNVESNNQYWRIGGAGEKTKYQFIRTTWEEYSVVPFWKINQKQYENLSDQIAILHLNRIKKYLSNKGYNYSLYNIGWIWNAGFGSFDRKRLPKSTKHYIEKLNNQYNILQIERKILIQKPFSVKIDIEN